MLARKLLNEALPGQTEPWVLVADDGIDAVAYFNVEEDDQEGPYVIVADMSGRHYRTDQSVIDILEKLQKDLGGTIHSSA